MNKTFVIAEAGANHDRKFNQALKLVNLAVVSGCDAVKFQTYGLNARVSNKVNASAVAPAIPVRICPL